ncbi:MAG: 2-phosphosulfolactate phosphatase [Saprospiraceae bacterium]|nr:2-phosphosulfolactate phosphatase [Saprospiraceae bacterium]
MLYSQGEYDIRLEWGIKGIEILAPISDVIIIVDVLSFSTCVDIATSRGAIIYPYRWKDHTATEYAKKNNAELASFQRGFKDGYSLSPGSLLDIIPKTRLILPSPNGSTLSLSTGNTPTLCGCLRNAAATAAFAKRLGQKIAIIPAGEQWTDHTLRVAFEDLAGAGAIISCLDGNLSPESESGLSTFDRIKDTLFENLKKCSSGKELIERGFHEDIELASQLNVSDNVPILKDHYFIGHSTSG